jgi:hypothetical protein
MFVFILARIITLNQFQITPSVFSFKYDGFESRIKTEQVLTEVKRDLADAVSIDCSSLHYSRDPSSEEWVTGCSLISNSKNFALSPARRGDTLLCTTFAFAFDNDGFSKVSCCIKISFSSFKNYRTYWLTLTPLFIVQV